MSAPQQQMCPTCRKVTSLGVRYCPTCGEPLDPALAAEIYELYATLRDLDARIAAGKGGESILQLRAGYHARYLEQIPHATTAEQIAEQHWLYRALRDLDARITTGQAALTIAALRDAYLARYLAIRRGPMAVEQRAPTGPAFSWAAFLQDGAIALMAYLGGFLLIIAAFTLIVGSWGALNGTLKLALVVVVHLLFLGLGIAFRRGHQPTLRTVGSAYLAVFALMVPVVALAVYRFALQSITVPLAGIICVSACYAAAIYLLLAWRIKQAAYGYLAWVAALIALETALGWSALPAEWWIAVLAFGSLALLLPSARRSPVLGAALARTARHVSLAGTIVAGCSTFVLFAGIAIGDLAAIGTASAHWNLVLLVTTATLLALALGWSTTLRLSAEWNGPMALSLADLGVAAASAGVLLSAALWIQSSVNALAYTLAALACLWLVGLVVVHRLMPGRVWLRHGLAAIAAGMALAGAALVSTGPTPNWPLVACLGAGVLVGLVAAAVERTPWWLLAAGMFSLALFGEAVAQLELSAIAPRLYTVEPALIFPSTYYAALVLALCLVVMALSAREGTRAYVLPVYVVALLGTLITTILLPFGVSTGAQHALPTADYVALLLAVLALVALIVGWRARQIVLAEVAFVYLGLLIPLPYLILESHEELPLVALAVGCAVVALVVRRILGRRWAYAPYAVALWAIALAAFQATNPRVATAGWALLGVSFATGVLLAGAALATVAAWWETHPVAMAAPAALALLAVALNSNALGQAVAAGAIVGAGLLVRRLRGARWGWAWYAAAVPSSLIAVIALDAAPAYGPWYAAGALLALAALSYWIAVSERVSWVGVGVLAYGAGALAVAPPPGQLLFSVLVTGVAVVVGVVVRVSIARRIVRTAKRAAASRDVLPWSAPWYGLAAAGSIATVLRSGVSPEALPLALLALAGLAYLVAVVERSAWISALAVIYGLWAAVVLPGAHPLVLTAGLALGAALVGAGVRLLAGRQWALALYAVAIGASLLSLGRVVPYDTTTVEAVLLSYALAACVIVAAERRAVVGFAPALYAAAAVVIQPDARLLLPVALLAAIVGMVLRVRLGLRWALPWYLLATVVALVTPLRALETPRFEPLVLLTLALLVYAVAVVERQAWMLLGAFALFAAALSSELHVSQVSIALDVLAFVALSYLIAAGRWVWIALLPDEPAPVSTEPAESAPAPPSTAPAFLASPMARRSGPRPKPLGAALHGWASIGAAAMTVVVTTSIPINGAHDPEVLSALVALLGTAGLLALQARLGRVRVLVYLAGLAVACSTIWLAVWLGIENVQAYTVVPGLTLVVIGALLSRDKQLSYPVTWGVLVKVLGSLVLLLPTALQTFTLGQELTYLVVLVVEALALLAAGLGSGSRALALCGAGAIGVAALRGAALAVAQGVPIFLFIAAIALLLLGGATWLSLRARAPGDGPDTPRDPSEPGTRQPSQQL